MVTPRGLATPFSGSQRLTNEPETFWQRSDVFSSCENLARDPSLSARKSRARTHSDSETYNKVMEVATSRLHLQSLPADFERSTVLHKYTARSHK